MSNLICFNKDSKRSVHDQIPSWIEQERAYAVASLKVCITWQFTLNLKVILIWTQVPSRRSALLL